MKHKKNKRNISPLISSLAVGAAIGAVLYRRSQLNPDESPAQKRINRALDRALSAARKEGKISLESDYKYIIFSDHHKGARNQADDFRQCEGTYLAALDYYLENGFTLIVNGDAEELWEEEIESVMAAYQNVLVSEARFHPGRYMRTIGNHDNAWEVKEYVKAYLHPFFPGLEMNKGILFEYSGSEGQRGDIFLVHGHQGTIDSDTLDFVGPRVLPYYRRLQILTGLGKTSPSQDPCLRARRDSQMYRWSRNQEKLILIAGHTHRPVWSSLTHLEKLVWELTELQKMDPNERPNNFGELVEHLKHEVKIREQKYPPCTDTIKTRPSYFNAGCCRFEDGDITGIELDNGLIRLIKWGEKNGKFERSTLEETNLAEVFYFL